MPLESQQKTGSSHKKQLSPETTPTRLGQDSKQLWRRDSVRPQVSALLEKLGKMGQRPAFSVAERRAISSLYDHFQAQQRQVSWEASAASVPLWPATFLLSCWAVLVGLVGLVNVVWGVFLAVLLFVAVWWEWRGKFRVSQLFFAPQGSHYLTLEGGDPEASQTLLLCVGMDTPPGDPVYQPESFQRRLRLLHLQSLTPATLLLFGIGALPVSQIGWWWSQHPTLQWLYWIHLGCLAAGCGFFYLTAHRSQPKGPYNTAVATALEVMDRLEELDLPLQIRLVFLGASAHGVGMESWLRQQHHQHPPEDTYILSIAPYGLTDNTLYYRTHEGMIRRDMMHHAWIEAAEQTAMQFARKIGWPNIPIPQRRFGTSITETAHRFGYPAITLGAITQATETPVHQGTGAVINTLTPADTGTPPTTFDAMAGWCVAVVQAVIQQPPHAKP